MKTIFTPNGTCSLEIIYNLANKEFGKEIRKTNKLSTIKYDLIKVFKKMSSNEYEENKLETITELEHIKQNDFSNFISIRFAYWAMLISLAVIIAGDTPIYEYFNVSKSTFGYVVTILVTILLVTMSTTIHIQHDRNEYLNFKMMCFEEVERRKESKKCEKKQK